MTISVEELAMKAMSLSGEAKAQLAEKLVESLDQESVRDIWLAEVKRRRDEVRSGTVKPMKVDRVKFSRPVAQTGVLNPQEILIKLLLQQAWKQKKLNRSYYYSFKVKKCLLKA